MTFTDAKQLDQAAKGFQKLPVDDQLMMLGSLYGDVKDSVGSVAANAALPDDATDLLKQVEDMRQENQLEFLREVFGDKKTENEEIALDPHPSKAMLELIPGAVTPPLSKYRSLSANSRLAFWYLLAQDLGNKVVTLPPSYKFSDKAEELLESLKSADFDQQVKFLSQVV